MSVNKIVTKVDGTINKTIDFNDLKAGLAAGAHTITVEAFNGATLVNSQTRNFTIAAAGDTTAPTITSATVEDANPDKLVVVFSEVVTITNTTGLTITGDATPTLSTPTGSGTDTITFTLSAALTNGQSITLNVASNNTIKDVANNALAATTQAITNNVAAVVYDSSYQAVLDYYAAEGIEIPDSTEKSISNQIIVDLKAAGAWNKISSFFRFKGTATTAAKLVDWKRLSNGSSLGSVTWSNTGAKGNRSNAYIDTKFIPNSDGISTLNSMGLFIGVSQLDTGDGYSLMGAQAFSGVTIRTQWTYSANLSFVNSNQSTGMNDTKVNVKVGINSMQRTGANSLKIYGNNNFIDTRSSEAEIDRDIFLLARNVSNPQLYSDAEITYFVYGANMDSERLAVESALI